MNRIKLITIAGVLMLVGIITSNSQQFSSKAKDDEILSEIAKYKTWTKVLKEPIKAESMNVLKANSSQFSIDDLGGG
jgi:hypothetical protein